MPTPVIDLSGSSPPAPAALAGLVPLPPLPPLPPRQRDLPLALRTAIDSADIITLRLVVATCAERDYATQTLATAMLVKKKDARQRDVKAEQWEMCIHCEGPFNSKDGVDRDADPELLSEEKNDMDEFAAECSWHPEEAEIIDDSDVWWDWDEGQGPMDTEENRDEYPEGFLYPCCEADGNSDPCKPRYHEAAPKKRPRH